MSFSGFFNNSTNSDNTNSDNNTINFEAANLFMNGIIGSPEDKANNDNLAYVGRKPGGTDIGEIILLNNINYIVKTGVSAGLLFQAMAKGVKGDVETEKKRLSFIVNDLVKIVSNKWDDHPAIKEHFTKKGIDITATKLVDAITNELFDDLQKFKETPAGQVIIQKIKQPDYSITQFHTDEVNAAHRYLIDNNPMLRQVLGLTKFADAIKGAYGQIFNNHCQATIVGSGSLDNHRLLGVAGDLYMASRLIENGTTPFDKFLLAPFYKNKLENPSESKEWLETCKKDLSATMNNMQGLPSAIVIRHMMGEGQDLGPDNMLLVQEQDKQSIVNIDVTGFRYKRKDLFVDKQTIKNPETKEEKTITTDKLGWEDTALADNAETLTKRLFDTTVFSGRFVKDAKAIVVAPKLDDKEQQEKAKKEAEKLDGNVKKEVMSAIIEVLKSKTQPTVEAEIQKVRHWLLSTNFEASKKSLEKATREAYANLDAAYRPDTNYLEKIIKDNNIYLTHCTEVAQKLRTKFDSQPSVPGSSRTM